MCGAAAQVPGCGGDKGRSAFSVTCDGELLSVGNSGGDVYVFSISGSKLAHFPPAKASRDAPSSLLSRCLPSTFPSESERYQRCVHSAPSQPGPQTS